jgi:peptidoglycan/xylan/chitin deacetylase (PgdA/CDA1 family)
VKRILAEGHDLASHTATHPDLAKLNTRDEIYLELEYLIRNVSQVLGANSTVRLTVRLTPAFTSVVYLSNLTLWMARYESQYSDNVWPPYRAIALFWTILTVSHMYVPHGCAGGQHGSPVLLCLAPYLIPSE